MGTSPATYAPQHFLYFLALPHRQGSFRPVFGVGFPIWEDPTVFGLEAGAVRTAFTGPRESMATIVTELIGFEDGLSIVEHSSANQGLDNASII